MRRSVDAPIEAFGGGQANVGPAVTGAISNIGQIYEREKKRADDVRVQDAYTRAVQKKNERFWDPKSGVIARRGRDAAGVIDEFTPILDSDFREIEESLSSSDQKAQFRNIRDKLSAEFNDNLLKHSYSEGEKFADETHKATIENNQRDVILNHSDPDKIKNGIALQEATLTRYAVKKGWGAEELKSEIEKQNSHLHAGVINKLVSMHKDLDAKKYFDEHKEEFKDPKDLDRVQAIVMEGYSRGEGQRQATSLIEETKGNFKAAIAKARKDNEGNPDVTHAVVTELHARHSEAMAFKRESEEKRYLDASNFIDKNKKLPPENIWVQLSPGEKSSMRAYLSTVLSGKEIITNWGVYQELVRRASTPGLRDSFLKTKLATDHRNDLANSELEKLIDMQGAIQRGDEKMMLHLDGIQSKEKIIDSTLEGIGIDIKSSASDSNKNAATAFRRQVDVEIESMQNSIGRKITNKEVRQIVDDLSIKYKISPKSTLEEAGAYFFGNKEIRAFEMTLEDMPKTERALVEKALKDHNVPVTRENIVHYFLMGQRSKDTSGQ